MGVVALATGVAAVSKEALLSPFAAPLTRVLPAAPSPPTPMTPLATGPPRPGFSGSELVGGASWAVPGRVDSWDRRIFSWTRGLSNAHILTVLSIPHDAKQFPKRWTSIESTSSRCPWSPAKIAMQQFVCMFHKRILSSFDAENKREGDTGCVLSSFTALPCPTSVVRSRPLTQSTTLMSPRRPATLKIGVSATEIVHAHV
mmetsp:Transcript_8884/g.25358  ORF Transcript_8884/g.25358 Transcript_8884/m.25358 type:complete len:201 (-) Transcript_8884:523-1125(-)